jgi:conjugal transfer pilus assembly protein TraE
MNLSTYRSHLTKIISQRNGYLVLAGGALIVCLLETMIILLLIGRERIVIVPPTIEKSFWVSAQSVSPEYLSEMTMFFASLRLNMTPENAGLQRETLLRYTDPAYYNSLNSQLVKEADRLNDQHISMAFYSVNIKVNSKKLEAIIEGDLKASVGDAAIPTKRVRYLVGYRYDAGRLLIKSFDEVKNA